MKCYCHNHHHVSLCVVSLVCDIPESAISPHLVNIARL